MRYGYFPVGFYLLKVNKRSTKTKLTKTLMTTIKTPMASFYCLYG